MSSEGNGKKKLFDNKQLIHVAAEVVLFVGMFYYISSKTKKLNNHIEDLVQKIDEQEELLQKHEQIIKQLVGAINQMPRQMMHPPPQQTHKRRPSPPPKKKSKRRTPQQQPTVRFNLSDEDDSVNQDEYKSHASRQKSHNFAQPPPESLVESLVEPFAGNLDAQEESDEDKDSDLEAEITEELSELQDQGLKKRK